jgi:hypothetical protein
MLTLTASTAGTDMLRSFKINIYTKVLLYVGTKLILT